MKLSTRSRYGMRLMLFLAERQGSGPVFLRDIAEQEGMPEKYLGQLIIPLKARGLVQAFRGARGGYSLARPAGRISLREIVETLEGSLELVDCVAEPQTCSRKGPCSAREIWNRLSLAVTGILESYTLSDLLEMGCDEESVHGGKAVGFE